MVLLLFRGGRAAVLLLAILVVGLGPVAVAAQPATVVSVNPFLPLLGFFQGEVERTVRNHLAVAVSVSHLALDDRLTNLDAKLRFYPQERAPAGLGMAAGIGLGHAREQEYLVDGACVATGCPDPVPITRNRFAPSFSVELHYQWLLGRTRRTAVGLGFGGKRYIASGTIPDLVPTGRLTVGWAFGKR